MVYFCRGSLPWQGLKASEDKRNERIKEKKVNTSIEDLCHSLPDAFASHFNHVRALGFNDQPNYSYLCKLFRDLFVHEGFEYDHVFDWTVKKFNMIYGNIDQPVVPQARSSKKARRPIRKRVSKSTKAGRSRRTKALGERG
jgi:hypothetical protein